MKLTRNKKTTTDLNHNLVATEEIETIVISPKELTELARQEGIPIGTLFKCDASRPIAYLPPMEEPRLPPSSKW
jgi:hypothetical protein